MEINNPQIVSEIQDLFEAYELALGSNDLEGLDAFFWNSDLAVRYGAGECLYGYAAIHAFRLARSGGSPKRQIIRTVITTFGGDFATTNVEFEREGSGRIGRQSQTWVRLSEGWHVVAGHISFQGETS